MQKRLQSLADEWSRPSAMTHGSAIGRNPSRSRDGPDFLARALVPVVAQPALSSHEFRPGVSCLRNAYTSAQNLRFFPAYAIFCFYGVA